MPSTRPPLRPAMVWLILLLGIAAAAALYLHGAKGFALSEPDEARYAEIGREMLVRGDWVTPHLNFVKYFEKPPLVYWATAVAYLAFGVNELAARLPVVLAAVGTLLLTIWLAVRMYGAATALLTLPILALGPLFAVLAQALTLDMPLTFFLTLAMVSVWFGWSRSASGAEVESAKSSPRDPSRRWYRLAYVATALAILVKGPVAAILVGGAALVFLVLQGRWRALRPVFDWRGVVLALVVALPWFVLVSWRNPEFLHFFVIDQHVARFLWTHEHGEPIWFFLPVLPVMLAPWGLAILFDPPVLRAALAPRTWAPATRFLVIWAAVIVGFFSLSTSKLLTYVLPAAPPLALLAARTLELAFARGRSAGLLRLAWLLLIGGPILSLVGAVLPFVNHHWRTALLVPYLVGGGVILAALGWCVGRILRGGRPYAALTTLAIGWFAVLAVVTMGRGAANDYRALGVAARAALAPEDRLAVYNHYVQGIPFYAERRAIMVRNVGELRFGSQQGDQSAYFWKTDDDLRHEWAAPGRLFLVINRSELAALQPPLDPPPIVIAAKDKKLLIVNRDAKGVTGNQ